MTQAKYFAILIGGMATIPASITSELYKALKYQLPIAQDMVDKNINYLGMEGDIYQLIIVGALSNGVIIGLYFIPIAIVLLSTYGKFVFNKIKYQKMGLVKFLVAMLAPSLLFIVLITNNRIDTYVWILSNAIIVSITFWCSAQYFANKSYPQVTQ